MSPTRRPAGKPARCAVDGPASAPAKAPHTKQLSNSALVHELQVHQVELEMQNEQLRQTQLDLAAARDRFVDLYDLAPVGYLTLDNGGTVTATNLTAAAMLATDRKALLGRNFAAHVAPADADLWHRHLARALAADATQRVELTLRRRPGEPFHAQLDCLPIRAGDQPTTLRITLTDNTQRKQAETERRIADNALDASEAERRHVARELHEEMGQRLSALKMELASLAGANDATDRQARITSMLETLDDTVAMVRRIATGLRPLMLDDLGLNAAIDWLARDTAQRHGLQVSLHLAELSPALDERTTLAMYRMVQETLVHMVRKAHATAFAVDLQQKSGDLVLTIQGEAPATGHAKARRTIADSDGARALHDKAHRLGGQVELADLPGRGTRITVRLPLARLPRASNTNPPREPL
jgi:two-component system sensor histidine kinase UhpB